MIHAVLRRPGLVGFSIVWVGQLISLLGSAMSQFALSLWAWQETGSATALALGMLLAGPLADLFFEPAMRPGGILAGLSGGLFGSGPGSGMALQITFCGLLGLAVSLAGYMTPAIRNAEQLLPDYAPSPAPGEVAAG